MKTTVEIEWDEPQERGWLCPDNISVALHAYCLNTKFKVREVPELAAAQALLKREGIDIDGTREMDAELERILNMTDEDVRQSLLAEGLNPDLVAENTRYSIMKVLEHVKVRRELAAAQRNCEAALAACAVLAGLCEARPIDPKEIEPYRQHIEQGLRILESARAAGATAHERKFRTVIKHLVAIKSFIQADGVVLPDGRRFRFTSSDPIVREAWGSLTRAIKEIDATLDAAQSYERLPGAAGHYVTTPDAAAGQITGDIEMTVRVAKEGEREMSDNLDELRRVAKANGYYHHIQPFDEALTAAQKNDLSYINTGVGNWCAPGPATDQSQKWMLVFEDADRGYSLYNDEAEAREQFARAEGMGWNCHLFQRAPRLAHSMQAELAAAQKDDEQGKVRSVIAEGTIEVIDMGPEFDDLGLQLRPRFNCVFTRPDGLTTFYAVTSLLEYLNGRKAKLTIEVDAALGAAKEGEE